LMTAAAFTSSTHVYVIVCNLQRLYMCAARASLCDKMGLAG
jgi:hypothetical protein